MAQALILIRQNRNRTRQIVACKRSLRRLFLLYLYDIDHSLAFCEPNHIKAKVYVN